MAVHASCAELERHFQGCNSDLDTIAKSLEDEFQRSALFRRVRAPPPPTPLPARVLRRRAPRAAGLRFGAVGAH